jgi:transcriptional regulator with XRE-family HTH domain
MTNHWTQKSSEDFAYSLSLDFFTQLEDKLNESPMLRKDFAEKLEVTPGAVSQILNTPPMNPKLESLVRYARTIDLKVSIVVYDDNDHSNDKGPIYSGVFAKCWEKMGCPRDLSMFETASPIEMFTQGVSILERKFSVKSSSKIDSARMKKSA